MSNNFYSINEFIDDNKNAKDQKNVALANNIIYKSDIDNVNACNIYIKAIEKVQHNIQDSIRLMNQIKKDKKNNLSDPEKVIKLSDNIISAKKIIEEFARSLSVIHDEGYKDVSDYIADCFFVLSTKIDLCFLLENTKYGNEALDVSHSVLKIFHHIKEQVTNS